MLLRTRLLLFVTWMDVEGETASTYTNVHIKKQMCAQPHKRSNKYVRVLESIFPSFWPRIEYGINCGQNPVFINIPGPRPSPG